ncbi:hypothetical protein LPJ61_001809 [Coemansia biformis]|uniref:Uncharacterized protein n=1 Tax=Coemansia biformis TaxID=1286918 RepID=A0A9W8CXR9_9FUNG|nr:hypothetical protein LPJ61_001809 [Coemansia biformis]
MQRLAPAQVLPEHVIAAIVDRVAGDVCLRYMLPVGFYREITNRFAPLLSVCCSWRAVALGKMCGEYVINLCDGVAFMDSVYPLWRRRLWCEVAATYMAAHTKKVVVAADYWAITNGSVLRKLGQPQYRALRFPVARKLQLQFYYDRNDHGVLAWHAECNLSAALGALHKALPRITGPFKAPPDS